MRQTPFLVDVDASNFDTFPCCGIKSATHPGRIQKQCWFQANARFGVRARLLMAAEGKPCGYIESIPGEFAWRGVSAKGYLFIHCIWMHAKQHQGQGWGRRMIAACEADAKAAGMRGVAAMVREGPWMAGRRLFLSYGFETVDTAPPDYELMALRFDPNAPPPAFQSGWEKRVQRYRKGLTIVRSGQCPYIAKFSGEIAETARIEYGIEPRIVTLESFEDAQQSPTPYAVFSVIYNGRVLADHQISRTRFRNIMRKVTRPPTA